MKKSKILLMSSLGSLSPNLPLIASTKASKEIPPFFQWLGVYLNQQLVDIWDFYYQNQGISWLALRSFGYLTGFIFIE